MDLGPFPPPPTAAAPARAAAALARALTARGLAGLITAAVQEFAVISVTSGLTIWTDGRQFWCTHAGRRHTWAATDIDGAAARIADLARPGPGS